MPSGQGGVSLIKKILLLLREAASARTSPIPHRLNAALFWKAVSSTLDSASALEAYQSAFTLLGSALALGRSMQDRHTNLLSRDTPRQSTKGLALDAALWALSGPSRDPKLAVGLLDQGRNVLLASVGQFRVDLSYIRQNDPALADEFSQISQMLESVILTGQDISGRHSPHEDPINRYVQAHPVAGILSNSTPTQVQTYFCRLGGRRRQDSSPPWVRVFSSPRAIYQIARGRR